MKFFNQVRNIFEKKSLTLFCQHYGKDHTKKQQRIHFLKSTQKQQPIPTLIEEIPQKRDQK